MMDANLAQLSSLFRSGRLDAAHLAATDLLAREPQNAAAHHLLGLVLYGKRDLAGSAAAIRRAIELTATAEAWSNLGAVLRASGKLVEAEAAYRASLALEPGRSNTLANLANLLMDRGRYGEAEAAAAQAVAAGENTSNVHTTLGNARFRLGRLVEAIAAFRKALSLENSPTACQNLAVTLAAFGRFDEAERAYRAALEMAPGRADIHSSLLFALNYHPDRSAEEIFAEYREFDRRHAAPFVGRSAPHPNAPDPERPLRIGYMSPDFCDHVVSFFMLPLLERHDRSRFDIVCYAEVGNIDGTSRRIQAFTTWVPTIGLSDEAVAQRMRADRIDVLVDLAGHSTGNRLPVFAHRPAPVQLSYMIGLGTTTGLSAVDGFICDRALCPKGSEHLFSEEPARMDRVPVVYLAPENMPPVAEPPAAVNGYATFGYFGRTIRLNDRVIATWSAILKATPRSKLMLNNAPFGSPAVCDEFRRRFGAHGIAGERLLFRNTTPQPRTWAAYGEVDVALDPFPHNAGTTTIEALWMGVPVVSLAARPPVGRFGVSILGALGLDDWVAQSEREYVARAARAGTDLATLRALRFGLRERFAGSALSDAEGLVRNMEAIYRDFWRRWCRNRAQGARAGGMSTQGIVPAP
jgi:predicted O-linked N-acetylglucosamine transferase (SPINDLY family)